MRQALVDLKARGLSVTLYPFVMMDIVQDNVLPNPWTGATSQPAYPWRGRISCDPAPGCATTVDKTAVAGSQISSFMHRADGSYRSFILHYAQLCASIGGVDALLLGSEFVTLTRVRSASGVFPFTQELVALAADVKSIVGQACRVSYSADWTEYGAQVFDQGTEIDFPLDAVWASPDVDFVGIDAYWPLSDWRDGADHLDREVSDSVYDRDYLASRFSSGEAFDWYYSGTAARKVQNRSPIVDGGYGKHWIFRQKDLRGWWSNAHIKRHNGAETQATNWVPMSKPIWLMEFGCPAVDRGSNSPNVFPDAKSTEGTIPPFSKGLRDDLIQSRVVETCLEYFDPQMSVAAQRNNPVSPLYNGRMVDASRTHIWAWDARPFPAFPNFSSVWSDGVNWDKGHWLNGRLEGASVDYLVKAIIADLHPELEIEFPQIDGSVDGFVIDRLISARSVLEPLAGLFAFDFVVSGGAARVTRRTAQPVATITQDDCVPDNNGQMISALRAQEGDLPNSLYLSVSDGASDYRPMTVASQILSRGTRRESQAAIAVITHRSYAQQLADIWLEDIWAGRETVQFTLSQKYIGLEVGDNILVNIGADQQLMRIEKISDGLARQISARGIDPDIYEHRPKELPRLAMSEPVLPGPAHVVVLDLAIARSDPIALQYLAVFADPWPGAQALWRKRGSTFEFVRLIDHPATIGQTENDFAAGPLNKIDRGSTLIVSCSSALTSVTERDLLNGSNMAAIQGLDGAWELFGFANADLIGEKTYRLSNLLRGLGGQDYLSARVVPSGANFIVLDDAVQGLTAGLSELGVLNTWRVGPAKRDFGDSSFVEFSSTSTPAALMPYAPVKAKAVRGASGVVISFLRRGRVESDAWEPIEIPLGEDQSVFNIEILKNGSVQSVLITTTTDVLYPSASEVADFGAPVSALDLRIYQLSASVGRGFALTVRVNIS